MANKLRKASGKVSHHTYSLRIFRKSKVSSQEIWLAITGIYWISGIGTLIAATLYGGKRIITTRPFEPNLVLEIISKYNVTTMIILPRQLAPLFHCERKHLDSLQIMIVGGQPVSKQMSESAKLLFPNCEICHSYGSSEGWILSTNVSNIEPLSVGQLYGNVEMKATT